MIDERITALPVQAAIAEWHVIHSGKERGPLMLAELVEMAVAGEIAADDLVKQTGGLWAKARDFAFLHDAHAERRRQRPPQLRLKDFGEAESQTAPAQASQETTATVSPAAWVMFTLGAVLFLLGPHGLDLLAYCVWAVIFGIPAYCCFQSKQRRGMTIVATLLFLAAGLDVAAAVYSHYVFHPAPRQSANARPDGILPGLDHGRPSPGLKPETEVPTNDALFYSKRGYAWFIKGDFNNAIHEYNEAIRLDPNNAASFVYRGIAWSFKKEFEKAIKDLDEAIRLDPNNAGAYNNRGTVWAGKKDYNHAMLDYDEAIRLNPNDDGAYYNRGNGWAVKADSNKAIQDYDEAIRLNPNHMLAYRNRGNAWSVKRDFDKAIRDYDEAIRIDPIRADAFVVRGNAWLEKKDYDKAIRDYDETIRFDSNNSYVYLKRGYARSLKKDYYNAIKDYDEAIRINPNIAVAYSCRGSAWYNMHDFGRAKMDFDEASRLDPKTFPPR